MTTKPLIWVEGLTLETADQAAARIKAAALRQATGEPVTPPFTCATSGPRPIELRRAGRIRSIVGDVLGTGMLFALIFGMIMLCDRFGS